MVTPVSIYAALRDQYAGSLLFESGDYHDRTEDKSYICIDPIAYFEAKEKTVKYQLPNLESQKIITSRPAETLTLFRRFIQTFEAEKNEPPIHTTGLMGYFSFESVQYMEDIVFSQKKNSELKDNPDIYYQLFRYVIIFDHYKKELFVVQHFLDDEPVSEKGIDKIIQQLQAKPLHNHFHTVGAETSTLSDEDYCTMAETGIRHCLQGDTFQVVLSREFQQKFKGDDFVLYRHLRSVSPSPYLFYLDFGSYKIFGSSPEAQIQINHNKAFIHPIAGTIPRGENVEQDIANAQKLKSDEKENAEHVMLVDLARNDLSRHCDNVIVEVNAEIQFFSQIIHLVSKVTGQLKDGAHPLHIFADTFPAGTLSGAPKYRAMQIINEQETAPRNFYGGSVGIIGFDGSVNQAIIIRSILSKNNTLVYQAGGGIVAKSTPQGELQEINNKLSAIRIAIQKANQQ